MLKLRAAWLSAECLALRMSHSPLADFAFGCLNWRMAPPDLLWARNPSQTQIRLDAHGRMIHADATMQTANWLFCADSCCYAFLSLPKATSPQPNGPSPPKPVAKPTLFCGAGQPSEARQPKAARAPRIGVLCLNALCKTCVHLWTFAFSSGSGVLNEDRSTARIGVRPPRLLAVDYKNC